MKFEFDPYQSAKQWDTFGFEVESFERGVNMLILTGLDAATALLKQEAKEQDADLAEGLETARGLGAECLADAISDVWNQLADQERFLRNIALVALMSRLTHALLTMLRRAETWVPRDPKGYEGKDEFKKLWTEFRERLGINLSARYIGWVEPYRRARNLIVHNGGEANVHKPLAEVDTSAGDEGIYDLSFSKKYPAFVQGSSYSAEVNVTSKLLGHAAPCAIRLVKHVAEELRKLELQAAKAESDRRQGGC